MSVYITVGQSTKKYYPQQKSWQFTAYQFLKIHIKDDINNPYCIIFDKKVILKKDIASANNEHGYSVWVLPFDKGLKPSVGKITIYINSSYELHILPAILTPNEFKDMAMHIARIIFNNKSFTFFNKPMSINTANNSSIGTNIAAHVKQKRDELLLERFTQKLSKFFTSLEHNLEIITKNPATTMRATKQAIRIKKSHKPQDLLKRKLQPHKNTTLAYAKVYDDLTLENRWLAHLVYQQLPRLREMQEGMLLDSKNNQKFNEIKIPPQYFEQQYLLIKELTNRLDTIQQYKFLQKFQATTNIKPVITTKLKKSKGYSSILREYQQLFNSEIIEGFNFYQNVQQSFVSGYIDNLSHIYEYWCLFVIYDNLQKLGFRTVGNKLEDLISIKDNNLILPAESVVILEKPFAQYDDSVADEQKKITITLSYEPKIARIDEKIPYTPDIKIDFNVPKRERGLTNFTIILDAKFKNYTHDNQALLLNHTRLLTEKGLKDCPVIHDVIGTAIYKYHDALNQPPNASVILHPNADVLWSGETPLRKFFITNNILDNQGYELLKDELDLVYEEGTSRSEAQMRLNENYHIAHQFGLLVLRPNSLAKDIRRLFMLIFHYHIGATSLCLCCGRELHESEEFYTHTNMSNNKSSFFNPKDSFKNSLWNNHNPDTKFRAVCKDCTTEWRVSFCSSDTCGKQPNSYNRIIKIGKVDKADDVGYFSLHHRIKSNNTYKTTCPKCNNTNL